MNLKVKVFILSVTLIATFNQCTKVNSKFVFKITQQGIVLYENKTPVYCYQKEPKPNEGKVFFNNYLHPLFSIEGDTLTEEFPLDHPHHRGVFWAWHQIYQNSKSIGDSWIRENISQEVEEVETKVSMSSAELKLKVLWKSAMVENGKPFVLEHTTIIVNALESEFRKIDFQIDLKALLPGISIGGSNDDKGYGGFCVRIKNPKTLAFNAINGPVLASLNQIKAGPLMDICGPLGKNGEIEGITILCNKSTPNYPAAWIIRNAEPSMQNIVFPGKARVELSMHKSVVLRYRLIIHGGHLTTSNMLRLQQDYD